MKPDWEDSPEWATHLARDASGHWHWFSKKPRLLSDLWFVFADGKFEEAGYSEPEWENSLEERPNED